jgi:hypothetical protein
LTRLVPVVASWLQLSEEEEAETSRLRLMLAGSLGPVKIVGYSDGPGPPGAVKRPWRFP